MNIRIINGNFNNVYSIFWVLNIITYARELMEHTITQNYWLTKARQLYNLKQQIKDLEAEASKIEIELKAIQHNETMEFGGVKYEKSTRPGSVDYSLIPQLMGVDLEPFRKSEIVVWKLKVTNI